MPHQRLHNYVRTYRRRHGFSQTEIAVLLGAHSKAMISRYEAATRLPAVKTVWAFEVVFGQPAQELFAGHYRPVDMAVRARARRLLKKLTADAAEPYPPNIARKVALLRSIVEPKRPSLP